MTKSDAHIQATQAGLALEGSRREGSVIQQLQRVESQERMKNRDLHTLNDAVLPAANRVLELLEEQENLGTSDRERNHQ